MAKSRRTATSSTTGTVTAPTGLTIGDQVALAAWSDTGGATLTPPSDGNTWVQVAGGSDAGPAATMYVWRCNSIASVPANFTVAGATIGGTICAAVDPGGDVLGTPSDSTLASANSAGVATLTSNAVNAGALSETFIFWSSDDQTTINTAPSGMTVLSQPAVSLGELVGYAIADANNATYTNTLVWTTNSVERMAIAVSFPYTAGGDSAALTGTAASGLTEQRVRTGTTYTLVGTLTGDTLVATGATFDAQRQAAINGLDSAQAEAAGWDAVVKAGIPVSAVVRTSDTVITITLPAFPTYQITATETVTWTLPASILTGGVAIVASPTFTVTRGAMDLVQPVGVTNASGVPATSSGSLTGDVAQLTRVTCTIDGVTLDTVRVITSR